MDTADGILNRRSAGIIKTEGVGVSCPPGPGRWVRRAAILAVALCVSTLPATVASSAESENVTFYSGVYVMDPGQIRIGTRVPAFKAKGLFGKEVDFEALVKSGRPVVLAFWSKYCKACVEKFSALVAVQTRYESQGLQVISVNTDGEYREGEATIKEFLGVIEAQRNIKINFPVIYDDRNWIPYALGITFLPTIISVDAQGLVLDVYQKFDEAGEAEILAGIEALVQKAVATAQKSPPPSLRRPNRSGRRSLTQVKYVPLGITDNKTQPERPLARNGVRDEAPVSQSPYAGAGVGARAAAGTARLCRPAVGAAGACSGDRDAGREPLHRAGPFSASARSRPATPTGSVRQLPDGSNGLTSMSATGSGPVSCWVKWIPWISMTASPRRKPHSSAPRPLCRPPKPRSGKRRRARPMPRHKPVAMNNCCSKAW